MDRLTRTVTCVDHVGPDTVLLFTEFDMHDRLLNQVRFEHLKGMLANALFTRFGPNGRVEEQWVFLYDENGRVTDQFGFDEQGRPLDWERRLPAAC
jgi:hypothetical protein